MPESPDLKTQPTERPDPLAALKRKLELQLYAGGPLSQAYDDAKGTGHAEAVRFGDLPLQDNPWAGGKLRYQTDYPNLSFNLDVMRGNPNIDKGSQAFGDRGWKQRMWSGSPNIELSTPLPKNPISDELYGGIGPSIIYSQRGDNIGWSPPSVDIGYNGFIGLKKHLSDNLSAFLEAKHLGGNLAPDDPEGDIRGRYTGTGIVGGLGWRFGGSKK